VLGSVVTLRVQFGNAARRSRGPARFSFFSELQHGAELVAEAGAG
jgi:hypothetical protein